MKTLGKITEVALWAAVVLFGAIIIAIPWFTPTMLLPYFEAAVPTYCFLYVGGAAGMVLLVSLLRIMHTVSRGDPFVPRNVSSLRHIAAACLLAVLDILFINFYRISLTLLLCAGVLLLGMLCAMTLAQVFHRAVFYKQENDLTI